MDRILSARVDESVLDELDRIAAREGLTKKQFLEEAIRLRVQKATTQGADVWEETLGAWNRRESPRTTIARARRAFRETFQRQGPKARAGVRR